jgi:predicted membrane protein (TIGR00267 family)
LKDTHELSIPRIKSLKLKFMTVWRISKLRKILTSEDVAPIFRRFFINTLFDSTFMLLGIVVGLAYVGHAAPRIIILTMVTGSLALGISTGVSVYETEKIERERKISALEQALFTDLSGTRIEKSARTIVLLAAMINFFTPIVSCVVTMAPFLLANLNALDLAVASFSSIALALGTLFAAGFYMARFGKRSPLLVGFRMAGFGLIAFIIGLLLNLLV